MDGAVLVDPGNILTVEELAKRLKVPVSWVYEKQRARYSNPLPTLKIGRYLRFDWAQVSAWLQSTSTVAGPKIVRRSVAR